MQCKNDIWFKVPHCSLDIVYNSKLAKNLQQ
jgi:hypothetical protein